MSASTSASDKNEVSVLMSGSMSCLMFSTTRCGHGVCSALWFVRTEVISGPARLSAPSGAAAAGPVAEGEKLLWLRTYTRYLFD